MNFPFVCSNIPAAPTYGVYISQLIRYPRAFGSYQGLLNRGLLLTRRLLNQGCLLVTLKSSLRMSYGRHHGLVGRYWIYVSLVEHLRSPPYFGEVRVTRSLVLYVCFVDRWLSFCTFSFGHCVVYSSAVYGFWLSLWYLQILHIIIMCHIISSQTVFHHLRKLKTRGSVSFNCRTNQIQKMPILPCLLTDQNKMNNIHSGPP